MTENGRKPSAGESTAAIDDIVVADAASFDSDQQLVHARAWFRGVPVAKILGVSELMQNNCFHDLNHSETNFGTGEMARNPSSPKFE